MKKIILMLVCLFAAALNLPALAGMSIAAGQGVHTHSDASTGGGTLALGGTLSSTKACASGFIRTGPNYCARTGALVQSSITTQACQLTGAISGVTDAKAVVYGGYLVVTATGGAGLKSMTVRFHAAADTGCATVAANNHYVAAVEPTGLAADSQLVAAPIGGVAESNSSGQVRVNVPLLTSGTGWNFAVAVSGYFD